MRFGVMVGGHQSAIGVEGFIETAKDLEARGLDTMWIPHVFGHDSITLAALCGRETGSIELANAVVPTYPRHPTAIAQQALTAAAACEGRFTLGIGLSHPPVIERMIGLSYARRASHMREYLAVLNPLLRGEHADFSGEEYDTDMTVSVADPETVPVIIAALGDRMLEIAGRETDGTITWMVGFKALEGHVVPKIAAAAQAAGRDTPRVVAGMHISLTHDDAPTRDRMGELLTQYNLMPSYKANIEREGSMTPEDFALIGDEKALDAGLERLRDIGITDFDANILDVEEGSRERTLEYLASRVGMV